LAYSYADILNAQFQNIDAAQATAAAELEAGRHAEDPHRVNAAAEAILQLDLQRNALAQRAQGYSAGQQQHAQERPGSRFGLTPEQAEIALKSLVDRKDLPPMTDDQKYESYARNRHKLHSMIRDGSYTMESKG
jgi:hypothetical protein